MCFISTPLYIDEGDRTSEEHRNIMYYIICIKYKKI